MDITGLESLFRSLEGCCLHDPQWRPADTAEILAALWNGYDDSAWQPLSGTGKGGGESESVVVAKLKDGNYGLLHESEDYTGHGCRCNAFTGRYATLDDLLAACTEDYGPQVAAALQPAT